MGNKYKLLEAAKQSNKNFKITDLIKLAEYHGFVHVRQKGSHFMMKYDSKKALQNRAFARLLPCHKNEILE